jgi:hypothetical protein
VSVSALVPFGTPLHATFGCAFAPVQPNPLKTNRVAIIAFGRMSVMRSVIADAVAVRPS